MKKNKHIGSEFNYEEFLSDSGDDYPTYDSAIVETNVVLAKDNPDSSVKLPREKQDQLIEEVNRRFKTGAQRDTGCNKLRHSLIPHKALDRVAKRYLDGAEKYGENNWKGMPLSVYYDSAMRHMQAWWAGDENEDHAAAAVWNMLCAMWTEDNAAMHLADKGEVLDDRHKYPRS